MPQVPDVLEANGYVFWGRPRHIQTKRNLGFGTFHPSRIRRKQRRATKKARGLIDRGRMKNHQGQAPLSPMASTGQPSLASLQRASSSGDSGCLLT